MTNPTRILILEDERTDAELAVRELSRADLKFEFRRAESKQQFLQHLADFNPQVILSDYSLPQFNGLEALAIVKDSGLDVPFILCTGSLTEEVAVRCMKAGVSDYILKSSLKRLPSAIVNAIEAAESRRSKELALEALRASEQEFRAIVETTNEWIWALDVDGKITYSNPAVQDILGYSPEEIVGSSLFDLLCPEDRSLGEAFFKGVLAKQCGWSQFVLRVLNSSGEIRYLESNGVPARDSRGELVGFRGSDRDITERKLAEERLLHDAFHDRLTGLANRAFFMEQLDRHCEATAPDKFALILVDMDRFKIVNDSLGYAHGDELLKMIAERLQQSVRPGDLVARLGGDDFTMLLTSLSSGNDVLKVVERVRNDLREPFRLDDRQVFMTPSIGVVLSDLETRTSDDTIRRADTAMYRAKAAGPGNYAVFEPSMHQRTISQLQLENEMRRALDKGEFRVYYQPIMDLAADELAGFEALVRWQHPERGLVMPMDFIPAAEASGLIISIGEWILRESCAQLRAWQVEYPFAAGLTVSVNLSCKQFLQPDLSGQIEKVLNTVGLDPRSLKLEITESHLIDDAERSASTMKQLRKLGVELSLDDFGTGYCSLSYLHRLPASFLKIDRSFVTRMTESSENLELVSTIIKLGQNLKMKVVAEGIENTHQLETLTRLGCEYGQGYFFAKPLEKSDASSWLEAKDPGRCLSDKPGDEIRLIG